MPKLPSVSLTDIEADLFQIEQSLTKIECPHVRYWITQFVDLVAEGIIAVDDRATALSAAFTAKQGASLRADKCPGL